MLSGCDSLTQTSVICEVCPLDPHGIRGDYLSQASVIREVCVLNRNGYSYDIFSRFRQKILTNYAVRVGEKPTRECFPLSLNHPPSLNEPPRHPFTYDPHSLPSLSLLKFLIKFSSLPLLVYPSIYPSFPLSPALLSFSLLSP